MKITKNKTKSITIRMTEKDFKEFKEICSFYGSTPSQFTRQLITMSINATKFSQEQLNKISDEDLKEMYKKGDNEN